MVHSWFWGREGTFLALLWPFHSKKLRVPESTPVKLSSASWGSVWSCKKATKRCLYNHTPGPWERSHISHRSREVGTKIIDSKGDVMWSFPAVDIISTLSQLGVAKLSFCPKTKSISGKKTIKHLELFFSHKIPMSSKSKYVHAGSECHMLYGILPIDLAQILRVFNVGKYSIHAADGNNKS